MWDFDIEVFKNFFSVTFYNGEVRREFIIYKTRNDLAALLEFLKENKNSYLVGFNSLNYDNVVLNYLIDADFVLKSESVKRINEILYHLSGVIINFDTASFKEQKWIRSLRYKNYYKYIDLLEVIREGFNVRGLKAVGVNLKWHRIQDLPHSPDHMVEDDEVEPIMEYNFNDVLITGLVRRHIKERLRMREILSKQYDVNLMSDADSKIGKTILDKAYSDYTGLDVADFKYKRSSYDSIPVADLIFPWVEFKTPEMQAYLENLRSLVITEVKSDSPKINIPPAFIGGMEYTILLGGIHSVDAPGMFQSDENTLLMDMDVASQYPTCILHNKIAPAHLDKASFLAVYQKEVTARLKYKKEGKTDPFAKIIEAGLKIEINAIYGLLFYKGYWLYDPKAGYSVTINNQLALLMLIEQMHINGIRVISANTDGIIVHTDRSNLDLIRALYSAWSVTTGFQLEETNYSRYIRRDINNYITVKEDGEIKAKGVFVPQLGILKGFDKPVVGVALQEYFLHGVKPQDSITLGYPYKFVNPEFPKGESRTVDIYDFCMAQKVGGTYDRAEMRVGGLLQKVQKSLRYYASNTGVELLKVKWVKEKVEGEYTEKYKVTPAHWSYQTLLASSPVTLLNDYADGPYDINYQYYIDEAEKIIAAVEGREWYDKDELAAKIAKEEESFNKNSALWAKYESYPEKGKKLPKVAETIKERLIKITERLDKLRSYGKGNSTNTSGDGGDVLPSDVHSLDSEEGETTGSQ